VARRVGIRPQAWLSPERQPQLALFPILSTTVVDHSGNSTTMEFSNAITNFIDSDLLYRFTPPPDAQVIRPPGAQR